MVKNALVAGCLLATATALSVSAKVVQFGSGHHIPIDQHVLKRSVTENGLDLNNQSFDYVVVGGGLAGLTVASRLSENPNVTVAVIEAGGSGYGDTKITTPAAMLYASSVGTPFDWQWKTVAQPGLAGREASWPRGKVLGGSSAINGLYYVRHSQIEQNAWASLIGQDPDDSWGWNNMLRAMKKSETFTPPVQAVSSVVETPYNPASHGTDGPIHVSWPAMTYQPVNAFLESATGVGLSKNQDPYGGTTWGAFVATSNINPSNWTRSFSRTGYLDPHVERSNLRVLTGHTVTKVLFDTSNAKNVTATGVQYSSSGSDLLTVQAKREVILCGGAVNDPQILQLSGIGDSSLLKQHNVPVVVDLPGVGYHLQDHLSSSVNYAPGEGVKIAPAKLTGDVEIDSYVNSAIAYVPSKVLFGAQHDTVLQTMKDNMTNAINNLNAPDAVKSGYKLTYSTQVDKVFSSDVGPVELLFAMAFGSIQVQAALQHPLSRGSIKIVSNDPFTSPAIDAGYLTMDTDMVTLREGFKLARKLGSSAPLSIFSTSETSPGSSVTSDSQWDDWIRQNVGTEYHPSCSCAMLPRENGGVVDSRLRVYGTKNLRVMDAAVPPFSLSAHLMAATYGIAEIGSEMILQDLATSLNSTNNGKPDNNNNSDHSNNHNSGSNLTPLSSSSIWWFFPTTLFFLSVNI